MGMGGGWGAARRARVACSKLGGTRCLSQGSLEIHSSTVVSHTGWMLGSETSRKSARTRCSRSGPEEEAVGGGGEEVVRAGGRTLGCWW